MTSKDVYNYLKVEGVDKLYKKFEKYFAEVDIWSERFATGDLLNEYELSHALDRLTGIYQRFHIIAEAIDAIKTNEELDFKVASFKKSEAGGKKPTISQVEDEARQSTKDLRLYRADFLGYSDACEKGIISIQARLKRLTVEKGAKGVDFVGEVNQPAVQEHKKVDTNDSIASQKHDVKDVSW